MGCVHLIRVGVDRCEYRTVDRTVELDRHHNAQHSHRHWRHRRLDLLRQDRHAFRGRVLRRRSLLDDAITDLQDEIMLIRSSRVYEPLPSQNDLTRYDAS